MDFLRFGFPLGYVGPISDTEGVDNHPSALQYPEQIDQFIEKEIKLGGVVVPFTAPPFHPWVHQSPLMSRPKAEEGARRVITDMTFPIDKSVNAYIVKNGVFGIEMEHSLPTVDSLVQYLNTVPRGAYLATMDISRAYKNFLSDPLDWPLLCFSWKGKHFCDITTPFGARASSYHMQTIAKAIVDILAHKGVKALMYLDDLIIISPDRHKAERDYDAARSLLADLALPEAKEKAQPPAQSTKWLGIMIDTKERSLAIPQDKLSQVLELVSKYKKARSMTKKNLQSLLGKLLHVAKCVRPARLFLARLLEALRAMKGNYLNVNAEMRADMRWFEEFCGQWNGKSYIPDPAPNRDIHVDACLSGIGGTDGVNAYAGQVAPVQDGAENITELEAINVVVALHTLLGPMDMGTHVRIHCDNMAAVQVLQSGRGRNRILLDAARAAWMIQAMLDVRLSYVHVPGVENEAADRLSRAHLSHSDHILAHNIVTNQSLNVITPCLHIFHNLPCPIRSRSGHAIIDGQGAAYPEAGASPRDVEEPGIDRRHLCVVRQVGGDQPAQTRQVHNLRVHRVPNGSCPSAGHYTQQSIARPHLPASRRSLNQGHRQRSGSQGGAGNPQGQIIQIKEEGGNTNVHIKVGDSCNSNNTGGAGRQGSCAPHVLWGAKAIKGRPPLGQEVRPPPTPVSRGCTVGHRVLNHDSEVGKEHAKGGPITLHHPQTVRGAQLVPGIYPENSLRPHPESLVFRPPLGVPPVRGPHPPLSDKVCVGKRTDSSGSRHKGAIPPQPPEGSRHAGIQRGMWRTSYSAPGRLEVEGIHGLYHGRI